VCMHGSFACIYGSFEYMGKVEKISFVCIHSRRRSDLNIWISRSNHFLGRSFG